MPIWGASCESDDGPCVSDSPNAGCDHLPGGKCTTVFLGDFQSAIPEPGKHPKRTRYFWGQFDKDKPGLRLRRAGRLFREGIRVNDRIIAINGQTVDEQFMRTFRYNMAKSYRIKVQAPNGKSRTIRIRR